LFTNKSNITDNQNLHQIPELTSVIFKRLDKVLPV
jgi:hypothetical protein